MILSSDLNNCPDRVARYLKKAGVLGQEKRKFAHIFHEGEFRMKPDQKWFGIRGNYDFNLLAPNFKWRARIKMFPLVFISVLDAYNNGVGRSVVKLQSIFPLANKSSKEVSESSLGRLLIEFILIPTALVPSEQLHWESLGPDRARVTFSDHEFQVSAIFEFGLDDLPIKTSIDRFGEFDGQVLKKPFICDLSDFKMFEGLLIPTDIRGCWDLTTEYFYWLHFKIKTVHYQ